jgi:hypothetical protein
MAQRTDFMELKPWYNDNGTVGGVIHTQPILIEKTEEQLRISEAAFRANLKMLP